MQFKFSLLFLICLLCEHRNEPAMDFTKHAVGKGAKRSGAPAGSQILVTKIGIQSGVRELAGARCACPFPTAVG